MHNKNIIPLTAIQQIADYHCRYRSWFSETDVDDIIRDEIEV
jgi:hypothetical protein